MNLGVLLLNYKCPSPHPRLRHSIFSYPGQIFSLLYHGVSAFIYLCTILSPHFDFLLATLSSLGVSSRNSKLVNIFYISSILL